MNLTYRVDYLHYRVDYITINRSVSWSGYRCLGIDTTKIRPTRFSQDRVPFWERNRSSMSLLMFTLLNNHALKPIIRNKIHILQKTLVLLHTLLPGNSNYILYITYYSIVHFNIHYCEIILSSRPIYYYVSIEIRRDLD